MNNTVNQSGSLQYGNYLSGSAHSVPQYVAEESDSKRVSDDEEYIVVKKSREEANELVDLINQETSQNPPKFVVRLLDQDFREGENLHLDCLVEGDSPIKINWFFNDQPIKPDDDENIEIYRESGVCSMEIISTVKQNRGIYKCVATNFFGSDETSCGLTFIKPVEYEEIPKKDEEMVFYEQLKDQVVELNSEVFLDCSVRNIRKSDRVEWYFNSEFIEPRRNSNIEIFTEMGICSLQIRQMKIELQGFYSCKVRNILL